MTSPNYPPYKTEEESDYDFGASYFGEVEAAIGRPLTEADRQIVTATASFVSRDLY